MEEEYQDIRESFAKENKRKYQEQLDQTNKSIRLSKQR